MFGVASLFSLNFLQSSAIMTGMAWITLICVMVNHCFVFLKDVDQRHYHEGMLAYYILLMIWFVAILGCYFYNFNNAGWQFIMICLAFHDYFLIVFFCIFTNRKVSSDFGRYNFDIIFMTGFKIIMIKYLNFSLFQLIQAIILRQANVCWWFKNYQGRIYFWRRVQKIIYEKHQQTIPKSQKLRMLPLLEKDGLRGYYEVVAETDAKID